MAFSKEELIDFLLGRGVVGFFPGGRKLKSGRISHWYANCRNAAGTASSLEKLAVFIIDFADSLGIEYDYFYGVPEGCTKLAILCNYLKSKKDSNPDQRIIMGRGKPKEHGAPRDRAFVGSVNEGDKAIVLEDVTTTGGSLIEAVLNLLSADIKPVYTVALVNRMEMRDDGTTVEEKISELNVPYTALVGADEILSEYIERESPDEEVIRNIEKDFKNYGVKPLKFS